VNRRDFLNQLMLGAAATLVPFDVLAESKKRIPWRNWSGSQVCYPESRKAPADIEQLQALVSQAKGRIRPVGSGHSFMPLVPTDQTIVSLSRMSGVISANSERQQATVWAGTRLGDLGEPLAELGQALPNMPDIDEQTLAGALGTATHGTGAQLSCLSGYVSGLQIMNAKGEVIDCHANKNADLFNAAKVNLGALGIVTQVTLQNQPKYRLKRETTWLEIEDILAQAHDLAEQNRNFEFYYIPFTGMGFIDVQNVTTEPVSSTDKIDQNDGAEDLKTARDLLNWNSSVRELVLSTYMKTLSPEVTVANSWQNYASERNVRFNEMEYHLPRENMLPAFREVRQLVESQFPEVFFPFEVRYIKQDDIWLSPFYQRDTCSIAVHRYHKEDYKPFFTAVEPIFKKYEGRPHWGKLNSMTPAEFKHHYPRWGDFKSLRQELDPNGKFLNDYLTQLWV